MNKYLVRIVAFLLVPCLVADPSLSAIIPTSLSATHYSVSYAAVFKEQALSPEPVGDQRNWYAHPLVRVSVILMIGAGVAAVWAHAHNAPSHEGSLGAMAFGPIKKWFTNLGREFWNPPPPPSPQKPVTLPEAPAVEITESVAVPPTESPETLAQKRKKLKDFTTRYLTDNAGLQTALERRNFDAAQSSFDSLRTLQTEIRTALEEGTVRSAKEFAEWDEQIARLGQELTEVQAASQRIRDEAAAKLRAKQDRRAAEQARREAAPVEEQRPAAKVAAPAEQEHPQKGPGSQTVASRVSTVDTPIQRESKAVRPTAERTPYLRQLAALREGQRAADAGDLEKAEIYLPDVGDVPGSTQLLADVVALRLRKEGILKNARQALESGDIAKTASLAAQTRGTAGYAQLIVELEAKRQQQVAILAAGREALQAGNYEKARAQALDLVAVNNPGGPDLLSDIEAAIAQEKEQAEARARVESLHALTREIEKALPMLGGPYRQQLVAHFSQSGQPLDVLVQVEVSLHAFGDVTVSEPDSSAIVEALIHPRTPEDMLPSVLIHHVIYGALRTIPPIKDMEALERIADLFKKGKRRPSLLKQLQMVIHDHDYQKYPLEPEQVGKIVTTFVLGSVSDDRVPDSVRQELIYTSRRLEQARSRAVREAKVHAQTRKELEARESYLKAHSGYLFQQLVRERHRGAHTSLQQLLDKADSELAEIRKKLRELPEVRIADAMANTPEVEATQPAPVPATPPLLAVTPPAPIPAEPSPEPLSEIDRRIAAVQNAVGSGKIVTLSHKTLGKIKIVKLLDGQRFEAEYEDGSLHPVNLPLVLNYSTDAKTREKSEAEKAATTTKKKPGRSTKNKKAKIVSSAVNMSPAVEAPGKTSEPKTDTGVTRLRSTIAFTEQSISRIDQSLAQTNPVSPAVVGDLMQARKQFIAIAKTPDTLPEKLQDQIPEFRALVIVLGSLEVLTKDPKRDVSTELSRARSRLKRVSDALDRETFLTSESDSKLDKSSDEDPNGMDLTSLPGRLYLALPHPGVFDGTRRLIKNRIVPTWETVTLFVGPVLKAWFGSVKRMAVGYWRGLPLAVIGRASLAPLKLLSLDASFMEKHSIVIFGDEKTPRTLEPGTPAYERLEGRARWLAKSFEQVIESAEFVPRNLLTLPLRLIRPFRITEAIHRRYNTRVGPQDANAMAPTKPTKVKKKPNYHTTGIDPDLLTEEGIPAKLPSTDELEAKVGKTVPIGRRDYLVNNVKRDVIKQKVVDGLLTTNRGDEIEIQPFHIYLAGPVFIFRKVAAIHQHYVKDDALGIGEIVRVMQPLGSDVTQSVVKFFNDGQEEITVPTERLRLLVTKAELAALLGDIPERTIDQALRYAHLRPDETTSRGDFFDLGKIESIHQILRSENTPSLLKEKSARLPKTSRPDTGKRRRQSGAVWGWESGTDEDVWAHPSSALVGGRVAMARGSLSITDRPRYRYTDGFSNEPPIGSGLNDILDALSQALGLATEDVSRLLDPHFLMQLYDFGPINVGTLRNRADVEALTQTIPPWLPLSQVMKNLLWFTEAPGDFERLGGVRHYSDGKRAKVLATAS